MGAKELSHLEKIPAILNLSNEVIINKNYTHKDGTGVNGGDTHGTDEETGKHRSTLLLIIRSTKVSTLLLLVILITLYSTYNY